MRAHIILDQPDLFSAGKMHIRQFLEHLCVFGGGVAVGDLTRRQPSSGAKIMNILAAPFRLYS